MGFCLLPRALMFFDLSMIEAADGRWAYQGLGWPGTLAALSALLSQQIPQTIYIFNSAGYLVVVARVMFNGNHFAVRPELHRGKAGRQAAWVVKCLPGPQNPSVSQSCRFLQWELTYSLNCL